MIVFGIEALKKELDELVLIAQVNELIRKHFSADGDLSYEAMKIGASNYIMAQNYIPDQLHWRIYDHSAFITRLYSVYETFVLKLMKDWLAYIPRFFPNWLLLPPEISKSYRSGIGNLLNKYPGPRTAHLKEIDLVSGLFEGISGKHNYSLLADAFFIDLQNLRKNELVVLSQKIGLNKLDSWLNDENSDLGLFCKQNSLTIESGLKDFIDYRNDCSHGSVEVDDVLGISELMLLRDFIYLICSSLVQFVALNVIENTRVISKNKYLKIGNVNEYFKKSKAAIINIDKSRVSIGDILYVKNKYECYPVIVRSMQKNEKNVNFVNAGKYSNEIGVIFSEKVRVGMEIIRLK